MDYETLILDKLLNKYEDRVPTSNRRVLIDLNKKDVKVPNIERKSGSSTKKYITHKPSASNEVQYSIIDTIFPYIKRQLNSNSLVEYNPMGSLDGELEYIPILNIPMFEEFLDSIKSDNLNLEMTSLRIDKIGFYCIEITYNDEQLYIFSNRLITPRP